MGMLRKITFGLDPRMFGVLNLHVMHRLYMKSKQTSNDIEPVHTVTFICLISGTSTCTYFK